MEWAVFMDMLPCIRCHVYGGTNLGYYGVFPLLFHIHYLYIIITFCFDFVKCYDYIIYNIHGTRYN